jgi:hypothetical protein
MTDHDGGEDLSASRDDDDPHRIEIVLPRARSIIWLGIKVYLIVMLGIPLLGMIVALLAIVIIAVMG